MSSAYKEDFFKIIIMFNGRWTTKGLDRQGYRIQNNINVRTITNESELGVGIA